MAAKVAKKIMCADEAAFRAMIDESPLDATPKLVFADWLEERGRVIESSEMRGEKTTDTGPPRWRYGHRYIGSGGDGGSGGYGGAGGI